MRSSEQEKVDALFRASMLSKYNSDPGPNWRDPDGWYYGFYILFGLFAIRAFLSS